MFKNTLTYSVCIVFFFVSYTGGLESGSPCNISGRSGKCLPAPECPSAKESFNKNGTLPITCINGKEFSVCCESDMVTTRRPSDDCEALTSATAPEVGQKSWDKCLEYQEKIMRPCMNVILREGKFRNSKCYRDSLALILEGGVLENEFPHMVLLGYGDDMKSLSWLYEGVIVSERFILTLAGRTYHREHGPVKYIRTGVLNMSDPVDESKLFEVKRIIRHPEYKAPNPQYNIALLEIENEIPLDLTTVPACIDAGNLPNYSHALAVGWDRRGGKRKNNLLQKRYLFEAASSNVCVRLHHYYFYDEATQICYDNNNDKLNYYGFEHILQIEHIKCMYVVIGLELGRPNHYGGISFTRISAFVSWIESIVWPYVVLDEFTIPACLDVGRIKDYSRMHALAWEVNGGQDHLLKDSREHAGGPIQKKSSQIYSFSSGCGYLGDIKVFTRVTEFVPWIENIVWP